ncbi:aldehyde dehydrogenase family protein, partial [Actinomadura sp. HBU206391]|uniref:aldehyde dehydrogenase family protein n=1 Tax=Actinomadura sp. HBU206391 TaxID=2731692 RepID=UPI00164F98FD
MSLLDPKVWTGSIFSGGWTSSSGGDAAVVEPATGSEIGRTGIADERDVSRAAEQAAAAQRAWAETSFEERAAVLRRAGRLFEEAAEEIQWWIIRES